MKEIKLYKVIRGTFYGTVFHGTFLAGRVWNEDTYGQSYPIENCEEVNNHACTK